MCKQKPSNFKFTCFLSAALLILFAATGAAHAQTMPVSGLMTFTFPGYTSIHSCDDIDEGLSPAECIDFLKMMMDLANDSNDPDHLTSQIRSDGNYRLWLIDKIQPRTVIRKQIGLGCYL